MYTGGPPAPEVTPSVVGVNLVGLGRYWTMSPNGGWHDRLRVLYIEGQRTSWLVIWVYVNAARVSFNPSAVRGWGCLRLWRVGARSR